MKQNRISINLQTVLVYLMLVLILYTTSSVYLLTYAEIANYVKIMTVGLGFAFLLFFRNIRINSNVIFFSLIFTLFLIMNMFITDSSYYNVLMYVLRYFSILFFCISCNKSKINLCEKLYKVIVVIAVLFLAMYILFDSGLFNFPSSVLYIDASYGNSNDIVVNTYRYQNYFGVFFRSQTIYDFFGLTINRLNGPFHEAGLYQIILNYAIFYQFFVMKKIKPFSLIVLIISLVLTTSTMGYIIFLALLLLKNFKKINTPRVLFGGVSLFVICSMIVILLQNKFGTISYVDRTADSFEMITLFFENPFIGYGFNQGSYSFNGLLTILVSFGFFSILFYYQLFLTVVYFKNITNNKISSIAFALLLILVLINEPIGLSNFIILMMTIGITSAKKTGMVKNNYGRLCSIE